MATIAVDGGKLARGLRFYEATIGKKSIMAVTGVIWFGFVIAHLLGNLQVYLGPGYLDAYGKLLRQNMGLLWTARLVLIASVAAHIIAAVQLARTQQKARPTPYVMRTPTKSSYASRTMYWSGPILAAFIAYHILHFTTGTLHFNGFVEGAVHANLVRGFQNPLASAFYIVAMSMLGMHLYHGIWSLFQTLGVHHPKYMALFKKGAKVFAIALAAGNISIPVSVLLGIIR